jgi:hypothetical protein
MITCLLIEGHWNVTSSPPPWRIVLTRMPTRKLPVESFCIQFSTYLMAFAGAMRFSGHESLYTGFRKIYQKHFDDARFDTTLRLEPRFESQKLRLLSVRYLLEKNQHLDPDARADLIRTILVEGNFRRAQQTEGSLEKEIKARD